MPSLTVCTCSTTGSIRGAMRRAHHPLSRLLAPLVVALALLAGACSSSDGPTLVADTTASPSTTAAPAPPTTVDDGLTHQVATSTLSGEQPIYDAPGGAVTQTLPTPWVGTQPLVMLVKEQVDPDWLEVYLPVRPNGSTGFVPTSDVELSSHRWRIEVHLADFRLDVFDGTDQFLEVPIAVASDNTPTPGGLYYTTELLQPPDPTGPYGTFAYGLSGYSDTLDAFNDGPGQLGIHGTNQPELIGTKVSHGCIRMRNEDIEQLVPVLPLGVPVEVIA